MTHKPNFEKWTADEMRATRRELINYHLQNARVTVFFLRDVKFLVRNGESYRYGFELKRYYYYEYK
jgi:hypothetical protein